MGREDINNQRCEIKATQIWKTTKQSLSFKQHKQFSQSFKEIHDKI